MLLGQLLRPHSTVRLTACKAMSLCPAELLLLHLEDLHELLGESTPAVRAAVFHALAQVPEEALGLEPELVLEVLLDEVRHAASLAWLKLRTEALEPRAKQVIQDLLEDPAEPEPVYDALWWLPAEILVQNSLALEKALVSGDFGFRCQAFCVFEALPPAGHALAS